MRFFVTLHRASGVHKCPSPGTENLIKCPGVALGEMGTGRIEGQVCRLVFVIFLRHASTSPCFFIFNCQHPNVYISLRQIPTYPNRIRRVDPGT